MARARYSIYKRSVQHQRRTVPSVKLLQRVTRGHLGRLVARSRRRLHKSALDIQRVWCGYQHGRRVARAMRQAIAKQNSALKIQSFVRKFLAECLRRELLERYAHRNVRVPATMLIQRVYRSHRTRVLLLQAKRRSDAANTMQRFWYNVLAKRQAMKDVNRAVETLREEAALRIQCFMRVYRSSERVTLVRRLQLAARLRGAMKIQSAWRVHVAKEKMKRVRLEFRRLRYETSIRECTEDATEILEEISHIQDDRKFVRRVQRRVHRQVETLRRNRKEMIRRIPDVEKEIDDLESDDERQGWMEALETEWSQLQHRERMCQEEIRGKRIQLAELDEKIESYDLEIEELEMDLDECESQRMRSQTQRRVDEIEDVEQEVRSVWRSRVRCLMFESDNVKYTHV